MQKYQSTITATNGSVIRNVPVTVLKEDGSLAEIFMDREGQVQAPNPLVTDSRGVFYFYAKNGRYSLRTAADGVQITDADTVLLFDPDETASDGPIADAVRRAEDAAERAETALGDSGLQNMVQDAQDAAANAAQAVIEANLAVASIDAALIEVSEAKEDAQAAAHTASTAASDAQAAKDSLLNYDGTLSATPEWSAVPAHEDSNLDAQTQAALNRIEKLKDDQQLKAGEVIEAEPSWDDVPKHKSDVFNAQAKALANRTEYLSERADYSIPAAKHVLQKKASELRFGGQTSGDTEIYPGAYKAVQGVAIIETPNGPRLFTSQRSTGEADPTTERCRIVEFSLVHDGSEVNHSAFSEEINIGHGQALGGRCNPDGSIDLYSMPAVGGAFNSSRTIGKGFSITRWKGYATSDNDVRSFQTFGLPGSGHRFEEYYGATIGSDESGKHVIMLANNAQVFGLTFFAYNVAEVESSANPLDVNPTHNFRLKNPKSLNAGAVGVAADDKYIYVVYGTLSTMLYQGVQVYTWDGTLVREFTMDGGRGEYSWEELMGEGSRGNPVVLENEGATVYKGRLYYVCLDTWRHGGQVVSFKGKNYACIGSNITGVYPYNSSSWVPTTLPAAGEFDPTVTYNRGTQNRRAKCLMCVASDNDAIDGMYPISRVMTDWDVTTGARVGRFDAGLAYNYPDNFYIRGWNEGTRTLRNVLQITTNGYYRIFDTSLNAEETAFGALRAKYREGAAFVSMQSFGGTVVSAGSRTVMFANTDSELPGGYKHMVGASTSPAHQINGYGQHYIRNFTTLNGVASTASPLMDLDHYGGSTPIQYWSRSGVVSGLTWSTTGSFMMLAGSNKNLVLGASTGSTTDAPFKRWVVYATDGTFEPAEDGTQNIASAVRRVNNSYFAVAPTVSSDARLKRNKRKLTESEKAAAREIKDSIWVYQMESAISIKGEDNARWHCGVMAQEVVAILQSHGLDWTRYAFIGYDEWPETPEVRDEAGNIEQEYRAAGSIYAIRYEELLAFIISAL